MLTGIDRDWNVLWTHPMPRGVYRHQVDFPQSVSIPNVGPTWLLPGPDGSVHFISVNGQFRDRMFVGKHLRGIAGVTIDETPLLILATDQKITAHAISLKE